MKNLFWALIIIFHSNTVKGDDKIIKPFDQWSGVYIIRNIKDSIHIYCVKDPKIDGENEKSFREALAKSAKEKNKSWIYGIKLQEDLTLKESRLLPLTEEDVEKVTKVFRVFLTIIPDK